MSDIIMNRLCSVFAGNFLQGTEKSAANIAVPDGVTGIYSEAYIASLRGMENIVVQDAATGMYTEAYSTMLRGLNAVPVLLPPERTAIKPRGGHPPDPLLPNSTYQGTKCWR
jgi:hypothetical protein